MNIRLSQAILSIAVLVGCRAALTAEDVVGLHPDVGVSVGVDHSSLSGSTSWRSGGGRFVADEDLDAAFTTIYVALSVGGAWLC